MGFSLNPSQYHKFLQKNSRNVQDKHETWGIFLILLI